jgi:hypothetical protein
MGWANLKASARTNFQALAAFAILATALFAFSPKPHPPMFEGTEYYAMAANSHATVHSYYAGRVLHPFVVGLVSRAVHIDLTNAFIVVSWLSMAIFLVALYFLWLRDTSYAALLLPLALTPQIIYAFRSYYYWPEVFYSALLGIFFLVYRRRFWLSLPLLLALYVTRESTILLVLACVLVAATNRRWIEAGAAAVTGFIGATYTGWLVRRALPSSHHVSMPVLYAGKIGYNFFRSFLGVLFWSDTNAATIGCTPVHTWTVPSWIPLGAIHTVGYCGTNFWIPVFTVVLMSCVFGTLPVFAWKLLRHSDGWKLLRAHPDLGVAAVYGALSFILAPLVGTATLRYAVLAWPLFLVCLSPELGRLMNANARRGALMVACSTAAAWVPMLVMGWEPGPSWQTLLVAGATVVLYLFTIMLLRAAETPTADQVGKTACGASV